jgi:hypothetical protein
MQRKIAVSLVAFGFVAFATIALIADSQTTHTRNLTFTGGPLTLAIVADVHGISREITLTYSVLRPIVTTEQQPNGTTIRSVRYVTETVTTKVALQNFSIHDAKGNELTAADALRRLKKSDIVVLVKDAPLPDPTCLRVFQDDTIFLVGNGTISATPTVETPNDLNRGVMPR